MTGEQDGEHVACVNGHVNHHSDVLKEQGYWCPDCGSPVEGSDVMEAERSEHTLDERLTDDDDN